VRICDCNDSLCCDESNRVFSVCDRPQVEFAADPETGSGDTCNVQFADLSTGCLTGWVWDFGDGGTSTEQHPTHTFSCNGPQTVSLIVTGPCGSDTVEHTITCTCPASCAITITSPSCSPAGCETLCTDNLYPLAWTVEDYQGNDYHIRYSTDGGGNWADVGTTTNTTYDWTVPDAVWPNDALIEVCCVGSIPPCCDTLAFFIAGQPQAGFTADPEAGSGQTCRVQFTDQSTNCVTSWNWNFGDGGSSTEQNPIHTFDCNGSYLVSLIVTGPCGADTVEHSVSCTCPASCDIIITSPTCSPAGCETLCTGDLYPLAWTVQNCQSGQFTLRYSTNSGDTWTDISTTGNTSFDWSVPDAAWPSASRIEVCCSGEDPPCCDTTAFTILSPPMAVFTVDQQSDTGQTCQVLFTDQSTGSVTAWYWDFGDGGNSTLQHPTHTYTCNGFYTVTLTVSGPCGGDTEIGIETITCTCPDDTLYLPGDVNCDGTITPGDALCAFWRSILGSFQDECDCAESEQAADVNCDGTITPGDALCIFWRSILGDWTEECICEP
jgi:PKD repeat protein